MTDTELRAAAQDAAKRAYAPYSGFFVGAALLTADGRLYTGCNIENAAYPVTCCAERTALFAAVAAGERRFSAIAIAGGKNGEITAACPPCGMCRQALAEFCDAGLRVLLVTSDGFEEHTLGELLPQNFDLLN